MSETIWKFQPDRTIYLRGFDSFAAAAAVHSASPDGFTVSGTFRDPADFAVAVLYDADNYFEHPRIKYLPDFDLTGLTLRFDLRYSDAVQPIDSPKFNWIDWATLDCIREDGTTAQVRLWDNAMLADSSFPAASVTCTLLTGGSVQPFDRATLWYQNLAFDYIVPAGNTSVEFSFFAGGTGTVHSITVNGTVYSHTEANPVGESSSAQADALAAALAGDPYVTASSAANTVLLTVRAAHDGVAFPVSASDGNAATTMKYTSPDFVAAQVAAQVNAMNWIAANTTHALMASTSGPAITLTAARYGLAAVSGTSVTVAAGSTVFSGLTAGSPIILGGAMCTIAGVDTPTSLTLTAPAASGSNILWVAPRGGRDGNLIELYSLSKTGTLRFDNGHYTLSGGSSDVAWTCTLDFSALGIDHLRQCWLTFAPALVNGAFTATEWSAVFSNWSLTGPDAVRELKVAGPGSVRIEQSDGACAYTGAWSRESGFYSKYFAAVTSSAGASVTITYTCRFAHDLWVGTSLYSDRANAFVSVDGDTESTLACQLSSASAVITRRRARTGIPAGRHTVRLRPATAGYLYFNFLEAVVASDVPAALPPRPGISPALDFDTDHSYKLPPARVMWIMDQLGYAGPMNEYLGVFWWNERKQAGASFPIAQITFSSGFADGDSISVTLNGTLVSKSVFPADTPDTIALHFAASINSSFTGIRASAAGGVLTITGRSTAAAYDITLLVSTSSASGTATITSGPTAGVAGTWVIDDTATSPLNRAIRDWHADYYAQCATRSREVATSCSLELVNPPAGYAAKFPDGTDVSTATGFGSLFSTQCAVGSASVIAYQKTVYRAIAGLQVAAGLTPYVQFGEFLWWYLAKTGGGMGYYDAETTEAALTALGRSLHVFTAQDDDPAVNSGADTEFLRNRLRDHVAALVADIRSAYPSVLCEVLWPYDVNYPSVVPGAGVGGRLNYAVNLPLEWKNQPSSGLDRMKIEALAFGSGLRNLNLAREAAELFPGFGWPRDRLRYLVPVFGSACPWVRELGLAAGMGITVNNLWAFDHVCLYNLQVPEQTLDRRSFSVR
ncbi:MAG TPA: hypothetical protein VN519_04555 [Bryobacteraceae bacterium]|nr:hypothetical protein [Bryobacteraceae bacterium]